MRVNGHQPCVLLRISPRRLPLGYRWTESRAKSKRWGVMLRLSSVNSTISLIAKAAFKAYEVSSCEDFSVFGAQVEEGDLSRSVAEYLLSVRFGEHDVARMNQLSETAQQGKLTTDEQAELDSYLQVSNLLAIMQSKGRRSLKYSTQ